MLSENSDHNPTRTLEMDKVGIWDKQSVISELRKGMELANELLQQLQSRQANCGTLIHQILSCHDNALALLDYEAFPGNDNSRSSQHSKDEVSKQVLPKKRKRLSKQGVEWSKTGFQGEVEDGYSWRKYGQKDILGANHPRGYYRCTHRYTQGCLATKLVQRTNKDPSLVELVYRGSHSCVQKRPRRKKENVEQGGGCGVKSGLVSPQMLVQEFDHVEDQVIWEPSRNHQVATSQEYSLGFDFLDFGSDMIEVESNLNSRNMNNVDTVVEDFDMIMFGQVDLDLDLDFPVCQG